MPSNSSPLRHLPLLAALAVLSACPRPFLSSANAPSQSPAPAVGLLGGLTRGDSFEVRVYLEPDLSGKYRVGPDGTIDFPLCHRLKVVEKTTSDVANLLRECLRPYIKSPDVAVIGLELGTHKKIFVFGHVLKPGTFPYEEQMSIVEAITVAGGFALYAGQNDVRVSRTTESGEKKFTVHVEDIGTGREPNFYLLPGDIIFVPESIT